MPRRRPKSRIELLADALVDAKDMQDTLRKIDLRKTSGELRDAIKDARAHSESAAATLERAILELDEVPDVGLSPRQ